MRIKESGECGKMIVSINRHSVLVTVKKFLSGHGSESRQPMKAKLQVDEVGYQHTLDKIERHFAPLLAELSLSHEKIYKNAV